MIIQLMDPGFFISNLMILSDQPLTKKPSGDLATSAAAASGDKLIKREALGGLAAGAGGTGRLTRAFHHPRPPNDIAPQKGQRHVIPTAGQLI